MFNTFNAENILSEMSETLISMGVALGNCDLCDSEVMVKLSEARYALASIEDEELCDALTRCDNDSYAQETYIKLMRKMSKRNLGTDENILEGYGLYEVPWDRLWLTDNEVYKIVYQDIRRYIQSVRMYQRMNG